MNKLSAQTRVQMLSMLVEGSSMRSVSRVCGVSINTVSKLLVDAGHAAARFHHTMVRDAASKRVQCDEIWSFAYAKRSNVATAKSAPLGAGDVWTQTALDADTKLILTWFVGDRETASAVMLMEDLRFRLADRPQISTDGWGPYQTAVDEVFGREVDYGVIRKHYANQGVAEQRRYSPARFISAEREMVKGNPDEAHISTSYVERHNLTMRMSMRRFTRLTNGFSKKFDNHCHALSLYFFFYNWVRAHKALKGKTPAIAAGLASAPMTLGDLAVMIDRAEAAAISVKRQALLEAVPYSN
jgi:IS1 family transposase